VCKRDESLWFKGLKYAEAEFKAYNSYEDGLHVLETELHCINDFNNPFDQGIRDYYNHVWSKPKTFGDKNEI